MPKLVTLEVVRNAFEERGCTLLEESYSSNVTPMRYICACGEEATTTWARFRRGSFCPQCSTNRANEKRRLDPEEVRRLFSSSGCELLEDYTNNYTPMLYKCKCGNVSKIRYFAFKKGQRCELCDGCRGEGHYNWNPNRDQVEYNRTFRRRLRHLVNSVLLALGQSKRYKSEKIVGYTSQQLKDHIHSHPNWTAVKDGDWHIDHIFPIKAFIDHGITDVKLINSLQNLQPLDAKSNLKKNASYDEKEFLRWIGS